MTNINFSVVSLKLDKSGILLWPEKKIAVASDLHLEKSSYLAKLGILLPPYEILLTLNRLCKILKKLYQIQPFLFQLVSPSNSYVDAYYK